MPKAAHQDPMMREHRRRYRIDGVGATLKLKQTLKALEECEEAIRLGLEECAANPDDVLGKMRCALRLLADGPAGEPRGRLYVG